MVFLQMVYLDRVSLGQKGVYEKIIVVSRIPQAMSPGVRGEQLQFRWCYANQNVIGRCHSEGGVGASELPISI